MRSAKRCVPRHASSRQLVSTPATQSIVSGGWWRVLLSSLVRGTRGDSESLTWEDGEKKRERDCRRYLSE